MKLVLLCRQSLLASGKCQHLCVSLDLSTVCVLCTSCRLDSRAHMGRVGCPHALVHLIHDQGEADGGLLAAAHALSQVGILGSATRI